MQLHELRPPRGAKRSRKRIGRGNASGHGTYSGKGMKGQQARAGGSLPHQGFEGGQTPLIRRLPVRRGFTNPFRVEYTAVNLRDLARLPDGSDVTPESLHEAGIVRNRKPIKLLGTGEMTAAMTVRLHRVSAAARAKIEGAGGTVEELTARRDPEKKRQRKHLRVAKAAPPAAAADEAPPSEEAPDEAAAEPAGDDEDDDGSGS